MKASYGNDTNMFVVSLYFLLKKNTGNWRDTFFQNLDRHMCLSLERGPTWECWLSGHKGCLFILWFKKTIQNISTEGPNLWKSLMLNWTNKVRPWDKILVLGNRRTFELKGQSSFCWEGSEKLRSAGGLVQLTPGYRASVIKVRLKHRAFWHQNSCCLVWEKIIPW